ncbi:Spy/CpxP family protein refolding chaperone [Candidatus Eisenbacteria bacterium]|uniref:Spy/CpxP family protein refolding chaperone n=1 Tax=Eiseniibacteriota bacterium TaxID=2212470 RepID=A0ABV6YKM6_UNCEI
MSRNGRRSRLVLRWMSTLSTVALGAFVSVLTLTAGCSESEDTQVQSLISPQTSANTETSSLMMGPPTLAEIADEVSLRADQETKMAAALESWRTAAESRAAIAGEERRSGRPGGRRDGSQRGGPAHGHGPHGRFQPAGGGERPLFTFIEVSADILDTDQFVNLLRYLGERQEAHQEMCAERRSEYRGRRGMDHGGAGHAGMDRGPRFDELADELGLTEEQRAAIQEARTEMREARKALHDEFAGGEFTDELRDRMKEIREQFQAKLESILTAEQLAQLEELRNERRVERWEERLASFDERDGRHVEFLTTVLDLTDTQVEQLTAITENAHARARAILEGLIAGSITMEDAHTQRAAIHEETEAAIRAILTPEQIEIFDALRNLRSHRHGPKAGHY